MKFGILLTSIYDASVDARVQRQQHEELVRTAEQLGFDLMVCGQHFLGSELRYFQPVPWLTHMAEVAPTMQAATGIVLLSMVNPVDIAEQMATLDVLTDGRAIFGVGLGYSGHEFDAFGVEPGTRVARFEESLALVKALWSGEKVDFAGALPQRARRPALGAARCRRAASPVWVGGQAAGAVKRAARMGDAWYAPPFPTHAELAELRAAVPRRPAQELGLPTDGDFPLRRELLIAPSKRGRHGGGAGPLPGALRDLQEVGALGREHARRRRRGAAGQHRGAVHPRDPRRTAPPSWRGCATSSG